MRGRLPGLPLRGVGTGVDTGRSDAGIEMHVGLGNEALPREGQ